MQGHGRKGILDQIPGTGVCEDSLVPVGISLVKVSLAWVFDKHNLVTRLLSDKELMSTYDIELNTQKTLLDFWNKEGCSPSYAFVNQVPVKCLRQILASVEPILMPAHCENRDDVSTNSDATLVANNQRSTGVSPMDDFSLVGELSFESTEEIAA